MDGNTAYADRRDTAPAILKRSHPTLHKHLFDPGPKRVLSLDGGGVLGVIEIAFIEKIEALLRERTRNPRLVLSDYFDLIGGTSTGAIIATALAIGMTAKQVKNLYFDFAGAIFRRPRTAVPYVTPQFHAGALASKLHYILGDRQLRSEDLKTGLAIIAKRIDTGSPWVLTNNPRARYWEDPEPDARTGKRDYIGNKRYKLRDLIRASTSAPFYFSPKKMRIIQDEPEGLFVDGGVSAYNNPSLQLLMLAGIKGYGFSWHIGKEDLLLISIGSGWARPRISLREGTRSWAALLAVKTLRSVIWDSHVNTLKLLQWISEPRRPWPIDTEIGTLQGEFLGIRLGGKELLSFQRYDLDFDPKWLKKETGEDVSQEEAAQLIDIMNPAVMPRVYGLAVKSASSQVSADDFPRAFDPD